MIPSHPTTLYRPTRVTNGKGGYVETLGTGTRVYLTARVHDAETDFIADRFTDIRVEDQIVADSGTYRVIGLDFVDGAPYRIVRVEKVGKPLVPAVEEDDS